MKNPAKIIEVSTTVNATKVSASTLVGLCAIARGDRVNAELQHAPAISKTPQVGVPALAGLCANWEIATA
jgi:hypothetical protein